MAGSDLNAVSLEKGTQLEKANHVLEKVLEHATLNDNAFLKHEGIFRLAGKATEVDGLYQRFHGDPTQLVIENEANFNNDHNNIVDFLKRFLRADNLGWSSEASDILKAELSTRSEYFEYEKVIKELIDKNHLEEAKMLHNVLHLMNRASLQTGINKMNPSNLGIVMGPWIVNYMARFDNPLEAIAVGQNKQNKENPMKIDTFGQSFDQTYPDAAQLIAQRHAEIPSRNVKVSSQSRDQSIGSRIRSALEPVSNWVTKTAIPAIKNFFSKTLPNLFNRLTGKKAKIEVPSMQISSPTQPNVDNNQHIEPEQAWKNTENATVKRSETVQMGSQVRAPLPEQPPQTPPPRPPRSTTRARAQIVSAKIEPGEQSKIKEARDKGLAFFKELEEKSKQALPNKDKPKNKG